MNPASTFSGRCNPYGQSIDLGLGRADLNPNRSSGNRPNAGHDLRQPAREFVGLLSVIVVSNPFVSP
jgi:hypothetical protein